MSARNDQKTPNGSQTRTERRASERAARKGSATTPLSARSTGPSMLVISGIAVVVGIVAIVALVAISGGPGGSDVAAVAKPDVPAPAQELRVGRSLGDPAAPVRVDAFEDPQCPACGLFTARIEPLLVAGPVTAGKVLFSYKDFPFLGPESLDAAVAMRAAEALDGKFWDYHQLVFLNQDGENRGAFSLDRLADMAEVAGLERDAFLTEMKDPEHLAAVQAEQAEGVALGINSTPSLVINGEIVRGVPTWEDLSAQIEAAAADSAEAG